MRLVAAVAVLVSHSFPLTGRTEPYVGNPQQTVGTIAVLVFFGISGFLITKSWLSAPHLGRYLQKRLLRIMPAYLAALLLAAFVIGPLATALPLSGYFARTQTFVFVTKNLTFWHNTYALPGVFAHNPYPNTVNGSIWTITFELRAYVIIALFGLASVLRHRYWTAVCWVLIVVATTKSASIQAVAGHPTLLAAFATGSILYLFRERVPLRWDLATGAILLWVLLSGSSKGTWLGTVVIPYVAVVLAYRTPRSWSRVTAPGDFSYGIYLWAFPVQQLFAQLRGLSPVELIGLSLPTTYAFGAASWFLIEKRALRLRTRSLPIATAAASVGSSTNP